MLVDRKVQYFSAKARALTGAIVGLLLSFALLLPARAEHLRSGAKMIHADESFNGRTITLAIGDSLELSLAENPSTGFRWLPAPTASKTSNSACRVAKDAFEPGPTGAPGEGGIHRWQFEAVEAGNCKIDLEYRRAWEKDPPPSVFRLQVEVRKGG